MTPGGGKLGKFIRDKLVPGASDLQSDVRELATPGESSPDTAPFRAIFEQAIVGIAHVGADRGVLAANQRLHALLDRSDGAQPAQVLAELLDAVEYTEPSDTIPPLAGGGSVRKLEKSQIRRDGSRIWLEVTCSELHGERGEPAGRVLVVHDVTESKRTEQALRESEERFRLLAETVPSMVWTASPDGTIVYANNRWLQYCGITAEQNARNWPALVLHADDYDRCVTRWSEALREGREYEIEVRNRRHDGVYRWFITRACPVRDAAGQIVYWFGVTTDIDDQKKLEWKLLEADRRKDEFLAMLAHELRNPLAPIHAAVEVLHQSTLAEPQLVLARDVIDRQLRLLMRLVDDLLDVARITRGAIQLHKERVALHTVAAGAIEASRPLIDSKQQTLSVDLGSQPIVLDGDPARLTQVITNLLNNAAKYTPNGGRISLQVASARDLVCLRVSDDGAGMTSELLGRAFELFAQGDRTLARSSGGLGIGLTLVRRLVEMHGGSVEARSEGPGKGSEFVVWLPIAAPAEAPGEVTAPSAAAPGPSPTPRAAGSLRVLVVDDNEDAADSLQLLLSAWNHDVQVAHDGAQAIAAARAFKPQLALLDIGLPEMSGYELAQRLRALPDLEHIQLVALSGYSRESDRKQAEQAGFQHYLVKPPDLAALRKILAEV